MRFARPAHLVLFQLIIHMSEEEHEPLCSAIDEGEWSASRPGRFNPGERAPGTHWIGGWVSPRAGLDAVQNKNFAPTGTRTPVVQPVAIVAELVVL
jgi:hypothetical protein